MRLLAIVSQYNISQTTASHWDDFEPWERCSVSWSVLGHVLSKEQSKDSSDGVSNDGHLTIFQCHLYHRPPLSDLYRTSVRIHPLLWYHQQICILIIAITNQRHVLSAAAQPEPHHAPHTFHVSGQSYRACNSSQGHGFQSPHGLARIWVSILWHPLEYESFHYMFITLPYAFQVNSLYVHVSSLYNPPVVVCILLVQIST